MRVPRVAVGPRVSSFATDAVTAGGGVAVGIDESPDAIVWLDPSDADGLRAALEAAPGTRWIQLPFAGIDAFAQTGLIHDGRTWTCAKAAYAEPVAEHALALALAGVRVLRRRVEARTWGEPAAQSLFDAPVVILGGGGIARVLTDLLSPFRSRVTIVRRTPAPFEGAAEVVSLSDLHQVLPGALVVFLALSLTPETRRVIGAAELAAMSPTSWLVNVARGPHVDTDALVSALRAGSIGGAALDVTDPEPLPDGHPLWEMENCIVTPHTADTPEQVRPLLAARITANVARFSRGEELIGLVDAAAGY